MNEVLSKNLSAIIFSNDSIFEF